MVFSGESPNVFFFDKCPPAAFHFLKDYLNALEGCIFDCKDTDMILQLFEQIDPLERVDGFKNMVNKNKNKNFIKRFLLFLHSIVVKSTDIQSTLSIMVSYFERRNMV